MRKNSSKAGGIAGALLLVAASWAPAAAAEPDWGARPLEELQELLSDLQALASRIPQYEQPRITEDGDIIIRRKHGRSAPQRDGDPLMPGEPLEL